MRASPIGDLCSRFDVYGLILFSFNNHITPPGHLRTMSHHPATSEYMVHNLFVNNSLHYNKMFLSWLSYLIKVDGSFPYIVKDGR